MTIRARYAPSPTGIPHIGNIRTALYDWLAVRHYGGQFVLRIEDTDKEREYPGAVDAIIDSLLWLGLVPDEGPGFGGNRGPYVQSERLSIYHEQIDRLIRQGDAYRCFCTTERLDALRAEQRARKEPPGYDRHCRALPSGEVAELLATGTPSVVRFAMPVAGTSSFFDELRGEISFENSTLDDFVLLKSDGYPTYNFAHVIDDHLMGITHVLRGEEFIPSTPKFARLYEALGWPLPKFYHLPLILGPDRSKLSKRHGATAVADYREQGFLPEALVNFLALLGWSFDDKTEVFSREELIEKFSLDRIGKTAAIFNIEKLEWLNGVYIRALAPADLADRLTPFLERGLPPDVVRPIDPAGVSAIVPLVQERISKLTDAAELVDFVFRDVITYDSALLVPKGWDAERTSSALAAAEEIVATTELFAPAELEATLRSRAGELGIKAGDFFRPLRGAVTGKTVAPPLTDSMVAIGRERTIDRIQQARRSLTGTS